MDSNLKPFVKWVGGKRQLINDIVVHLPNKYDKYFEPFLGAGAVFLFLKPNVAYINDMNKDLINAYLVIRDNVEKLIYELKKHNENNSKDYYYQIREWDRKRGFNNRSNVSKAARFIYMNKVGYNGLYRVNQNGQFNVPYGRYNNPKIVDEDLLRNISYYLNNNDIHILSEDFEDAVQDVSNNDLVYFDPPYDPLNETSSFTGYQKGGFDKEEQKRLKLCADALVRRGAKVILSNSNTEFIKALYSNKIESASSEISYYIIKLVDARRNVNSNASKRGKIKEVLIISKGDKNER
ncbi:MAG: DNA adenine methylase [bacterium]